MKTELIGRQVRIKDNIDSIYNGEWGVIKGSDGDDFHIAMWSGQEQMVFTRKEFTVRRLNK
jgi:hypothetical protein